jgi:RNA polymerase sigma-70 factor (ECF subfamily)
MPGADPGGFADFYASQFPRIATQIYAYLGDHAEAQDIAQEAFVRAYDRWVVIGGYDDPVAWVRRVAWNLATSRLRRVKVALAYVSRQREEHMPEPSPDRVALIQALAKLPDKQRLAVVLHYLANMPTAEIARQLSVADGTVRSWLSRGRTRLANCFECEQEEVAHHG